MRRPPEHLRLHLSQPCHTWDECGRYKRSRDLSIGNYKASNLQLARKHEEISQFDVIDDELLSHLLTDSCIVWTLRSPLLGLAMSPHDFVLTARICLGIHLFLFTKISEMCPSLWHLVTCCHGPLRIKHHDKLYAK